MVLLQRVKLLVKQIKTVFSDRQTVLQVGVSRGRNLACRGGKGHSVTPGPLHICSHLSSSSLLQLLSDVKRTIIVTLLLLAPVSAQTQHCWCTAQLLVQQHRQHAGRNLFLCRNPIIASSMKFSFPYPATYFLCKILCINEDKELNSEISSHATTRNLNKLS